MRFCTSHKNCHFSSQNGVPAKRCLLLLWLFLKEKVTFSDVIESYVVQHQRNRRCFARTPSFEQSCFSFIFSSFSFFSFFSREFSGELQEVSIQKKCFCTPSHPKCDVLLHRVHPGWRPSPVETRAHSAASVLSRSLGSFQRVELCHVSGCARGQQRILPTDNARGNCDNRKIGCQSRLQLSKQEHANRMLRITIALVANKEFSWSSQCTFQSELCTTNEKWDL